MDAVTVTAPSDQLLDLVAPFALATHRPTAIVVDLDGSGLPFPGRRTLAHLVEEQPTLTDLVPPRRGIVSLPNGGVDAEAALPVVDALRRGWPAVVIRSRRPLPGVAHAPVVPRLPGQGRAAAVWVRTGLADSGGEGPVVRAPSRRAFHQVLDGRALTGSWLRSWAAVWSWPWP